MPLLLLLPFGWTLLLLIVGFNKIELFIHISKCLT
jgi:hypothetical protein